VSRAAVIQILNRQKLPLDEDKDRLNIKKHGVSFSEIMEVFDDPAFLEGYDRRHSTEEARYYGIGCLNNILYIVVFYTLRTDLKTDAEQKRIISARQTDPDEQEEYNGYFEKIKP
jgi:uncharacterized DUF497 family protein